MEKALRKVLANGLTKLGWHLALAESCTGGKLAAALIEIPGSSIFFDRGFIVYSNQAKQEELGVDKKILLEYGAVSAEVALAMVKGLACKSKAELLLSITGIAGPTGGSLGKPVGLVYFGWGRKGEWGVHRRQFRGSRTTIQALSVQWAIKKLNSLIC